MQELIFINLVNLNYATSNLMLKVINSHDKDLVTLAKKNHHILTFFVELVTTSFFYQNYFCIMV